MHSDDVILARAACSWLRRGHWRSGELSLSCRQVTFWTAEDGVVLRIPIFTITANVVTPVKHRLMVQTGDQSLWFTGASVAALGHRLTALRDENDNDFEEEEIILLAGPTRSRAGLLPISGLVQLTDRRLRFVAEGLMARFLRWLGRSPDWEIPATLAAHGHPLHGPLGWLIGLSLESTGATRTLAGWLLRSRLHRGALLLTTEGLRIVDRTERRFPLESIIAITSTEETLTIHLRDSNPVELRLSHAAAAQRHIQIALSILPGPDQISGDVDMPNTLELLPEPDRIQPWSVERQDSLLAETRSTRLWMPDGQILEMKPGMAMPTTDGIAIALPEHTPHPPPGSQITVELGQPGGVHRFETTVLRIAPLPTHIQIPRRGRLLVVSTPDEMRYYNRRSAFRVPMRLRVNAWRLRPDEERKTWVPDGGRIAGDLLDLSATGCAIQTDDEVAIGTRMFLELRIEEHWIPLEAEVVRSGQGWPAGRCRLGIHFLNVPERLGRLLSQTVLAQQRGG